MAEKSFHVEVVSADAELPPPPQPEANRATANGAASIAARRPFRMRPPTSHARPSEDFSGSHHTVMMFTTAIDERKHK